MDDRDGMAALVDGYRILHLAQGSGLVSKVMFLDMVSLQGVM